MTKSSPTPHTWPLILLSISVIPLIVQIAAGSSSAYGYFIDELYYLACARHLAAGYVDHPPLAPLLLAGVRLVFGESRLAIRILPFLAGGATAWLGGLLALELGGGLFAMTLAALTIGLGPGMLALCSFYSMNAFEPLLWTLVILLTVRLTRSHDVRLWLPIGITVGIGLENKHTFLVYVAALGAGILATSTRRLLATRWFVIGGAAAAALILPNVLWQMANGWPSLEFYRNAQALKNVPTPPLRSIVAQIFFMNPIVAPIWMAGLFALVAGRWRELRFLGWSALFLFAVQIASQSSRPDRIAAIYPLLLAAGAVTTGDYIRNHLARGTLVAAVAASAALLLPLVTPVLPPPALAAYLVRLGLQEKIALERGKTSSIPQLLADRTGWESFIDDIDRVYHRLPEDDRRRAVVYVPDYGHAGALDLWGPSRGLPRVISSQNTYYHWSVGHADADVLIAVGANPKDLGLLYSEYSLVDVVSCDYCMSWRARMPIYVARQPIMSLNAFWPRTRHYE
jgi:4-amino-4-deoxy-L-arabinose transferase-like glycosyltransferase